MTTLAFASEGGPEAVIPSDDPNSRFIDDEAEEYARSKRTNGA